MSRFSQVKERLVIHADWWDDNETVTIKRFSWGDRHALTDKMVLVTGLSKRGDTLVKNMSVERTNLAIFKAGIESWTFLDDDGTPVPAITKSFKVLNDEDGEFILRAIDELNPTNNQPNIEQLEARLLAAKEAADDDEDFLTI